MEEGVAIPYGTPLAKQWLHVLDSRLRPCPDWTVGHLYIGGAGLARGYLNDAQRTRERFIVHPQSGERRYHTGDLGRYRPDGVIEFLGRDDTQVKIRGHRIELGEVERVLGSHPAVRAAVALITGETPSAISWPRLWSPAARSKTPCLRSRDPGYVCAAAGDAAIAGWTEAAWPLDGLSNRTALLGMVGTLRGLVFFADKAASTVLRHHDGRRVHPRMRRCCPAGSPCCATSDCWSGGDSGLYKLAATPPEARELPL
jgi:pyochelin synthetase